MSPHDATLKAMEEVAAPVVAIALILIAMFIPTAFIPGITGRMYQQFAVTIAVSVAFSAFNALTLSPALSAMLLRPKRQSRGPVGSFFRWFNDLFSKATNGYVRACRHSIRKSAIGFLLAFSACLRSCVLREKRSLHTRPCGSTQFSNPETSTSARASQRTIGKSAPSSGFSTSLAAPTTFCSSTPANPSHPNRPAYWRVSLRL